MAEERLKLAVFIDFDNIQIGVKDTLGKDFDVSLVLEALKERGEVVTKVAYADWHRAGEQSRQMTQHAVQMVQRNVTPRGDKNAADINLALDALEMAFTRHHISAFAIVGGDSDFIPLVEKLKQYDKRVFVVGGRAFTSNILQRNCTEFIAYENLLSGDGPRAARASRRGGPAVRAGLEPRPLREAFSNVQRALKILSDRGVAPQIGLLKSTLLQLDSTFSERDFGAGSFLEFMQKMEGAHLVHLRRTDRGFLVEPVNGEVKAVEAAQASEGSGAQVQAARPVEEAPEAPTGPGAAASPLGTSAEALELFKQALAAASQKAPNRPLYLRQVRQGLRSADKNFDERRYGLHGVHDLLHLAQREGLVRLQRDRKGILRIFPAPSVATAPAAPAAGEPVVQGEAAASTDFWDATETMTAIEVAPGAAEVPGVETTVPEGAAAPIEEAGVAEAPSEAPTGHRARRPRAAGARRRASSRRKPKEPSE